MTTIRFQGENQNVYYEFDKDSTPLGAGGMGCIYQGFRIDLAFNIQSIVAVKCIKPELVSNPSIIQRAQREASVQLDNPNLIRMYGFFSGAEFNQLAGTYTPTYYIAMERLMGVNLDEILFKGVTTDKSNMTVPIAQELLEACETDRTAAIVSVMREVLKGISALHAAGFIHRDIDPSNVMLTQDGRIKIIDFGISKPIWSSSYGGGLTQAGQFLGKMAYAAPELIIGDLKSQGPATDIYALGIMFFQLITGYLPVSGTDQDVMTAHISGNTNCSAIENKSVRRIIEKAISKDISSRYESADEMLDDLNSIDFSSRASNKEIAGSPVSRGMMGAQHPVSLPSWVIGVAIVIGLALGAVLQFII